MWNRTGGSELRRLSRAGGSERSKDCWGQSFATQGNEASLRAGEAKFPLAAPKKTSHSEMFFCLDDFND